MKLQIQHGESISGLLRCYREEPSCETFKQGVAIFLFKLPSPFPVFRQERGPDLGCPLPGGFVGDLHGEGGGEGGGDGEKEAHGEKTTAKGS
jgi:hypothetical protein